MGEVLATACRAHAWSPSSRRARRSSRGKGARPRDPGIGASFVPGILNRAVIDEVVQVKDEDAMATALRLAREEGLLAGISAGANVWAALGVAERLGPAGSW